MQLLIIGACPGLSACARVLYEEASGEEILFTEQRDLPGFDLEREKFLIELHHLDSGFCEYDPELYNRDGIPTMRQLRKDNRKPKSAPAVRNWQIDHQVRCRGNSCHLFV